MSKTVPANSMELYEQTILSYAALCYAMACELTGNPEEAGDLARRELLRVRQLHENLDGTLGIKMELLAGLWRRFLDGDFGQPRVPAIDERIEATKRPGNVRHASRHAPRCSQGLRTPVLLSRPGDRWPLTRYRPRGAAARNGHSGIGQH